MTSNSSCRSSVCQHLISGLAVNEMQARSSCDAFHLKVDDVLLTSAVHILQSFVLVCRKSAHLTDVLQTRSAEINFYRYSADILQTFYR